MKKIITIIGIMLCSIHSIDAQSNQITFTKVYHDSLQNGIIANAMVATNDNGYLIVGGTLLLKAQI